MAISQEELRSNAINNVLKDLVETTDSRNGWKAAAIAFGILYFSELLMKLDKLSFVWHS